MILVHYTQIKQPCVCVNVGAGLLPKLKFYLYGFMSTRNLRPAHRANQPQTRCMKNTPASMDTERVGLKHVTNYFSNLINIQFVKRPTPTAIKFYGGVS